MISGACGGGRIAAAATIAMLVAGCGSYGGATSPTITRVVIPDVPAEGPTVTITASGVTPLEISVPVGSRVIFQNNDSVAHHIAGGPDPARPDCREIDTVGFLTPGQRGATAALVTARTCEYHDHGFVSTSIYTGRIVIR